MTRRTTLRGPTLRTAEECWAIGTRLLELASGGEARVRIYDWLSGSTAFARGETHAASESTGLNAELRLRADGRESNVRTNQCDEAGLRDAAERAWRLLRAQRAPAAPSPRLPIPPQPAPPELLFSATMDAMPASMRATVVNETLDMVEAAGLTAAGACYVGANGRAYLDSDGRRVHSCVSLGDFSLTVRTTDGRGSGWAWGGSEDWSRIRPEQVTVRAVDLARRSARPEAVEPGRYTVILEPMALADLMSEIQWSARYANNGMTVFSKMPRGTNKIGLRMLDERFSIVSDPWDPELPQETWSFDYDWPVERRVTLFDHGVLKNLVYDPEYAHEQGREPVLVNGIRLSAAGPTQTLEEMIASTQRGIWVNRFSNVTGMNSRTLLLSGTTRDGTFLIEKGKITKAIKNFRFTESPFFILNKVEAVGVPVRTGMRSVVPRVKVRDFDFTSLTDAV